MSTPWASKLASSAKTLPPPAPENKYNVGEVLAYLSDTFNAHVQEAKQDKAGETIKTYRSLEASSQWKTTKPARKEAAMDLMAELNKSLAKVQ
ncbi:uncharacterized protein CANTADRAFT_47366 [Suhomyces tanzawaensis NRRL Y-17324]|uniref:Uncharacterized protein n=1 Tax=Suhomyces tanzawaensis NRRL Y-17324 TaxID=984487 RepID=A0A1E4SMH5_9ASCO|nr:uncharacterized protein CANTADRAFT_47366 [Suhomyces tanzawaensis NRRL Y-17324]ODV80729.1 hypothetical protein CANTADRAFT_47366 [Suhomyces tanzawaensis NRRL Y-17324]